MDLSKLNYPSVENRLRDALQEYFYERIGSRKDFSKWFESIGQVTDDWKMMEKNPHETLKINNQFGVPEWFMRAMHATI